MRWRRGTQHLLLPQPGVCNPNQRAVGFWQPPGIQLQMLGTWFAELTVTEGWSGVVLAGCLPQHRCAGMCLFVPSATDTGAVVDSKEVKTPRWSEHC